MSFVPHGKFSGRHLLIVGCGYVGTAVAENAREAGLAVTALTRNEPAAAHLQQRGIQVVVADAATDAWHEQVGKAPDLVLNCLSGGGAGLEGYRRSYLRGMESVLRWAGQAGGVRTLVYTSSTSVYPQDGGVRVDETCPVADGGPELGVADERASVLVETERRLAAQHDRCERWFILRLAGIYGPGRHYLLEQVRSGTVAGTGEHHLNLAHRDDIVAAIASCFAALPGVGNALLNVADDGPARKREVVAWLAERCGVPIPVFTGQPAAGRRAITPDRIIANSKLKQLLGWTPKFPTFREGYAEILSRRT